MKEALELKIPIICANPDVEVIENNHLRYCGGFIAAKYEKMGGIVHHYGKPHLAAFQEAFSRFEKYGVKQRNRILMIGDSLETDILGAQRAGIDSALVMTGNTELRLKKLQAKGLGPSLKAPVKVSDGELLDSLFQRYGVVPTWTIPSLSLDASHKAKLHS